MDSKGITRIIRDIAGEARTANIASRIALTFNTKEEMEKYKQTHDVRPTTKLEVKPNHLKKQEGEIGQMPHYQGLSEHPKDVVHYNPSEKYETKKWFHDEHKHVCNKKQLADSLSKGHYTIISAGRNPDDPEEAKLPVDHPFFKWRHLKLQSELEKAGVKYNDVVGHYGGLENSFLVMHDGGELDAKNFKPAFKADYDEKQSGDLRKLMNHLGEKYNQNSVLHGAKGRNEINFTSGKHKGKTCGGNGWNFADEEKDFYTELNLKDRPHSKIQMDIHECFKDKGGLLNS